MTAFVSIAIGKKPSKRAAKGINFSGATSKRARRDGRHEEHENVPTRRPIIDADIAIAESLNGVVAPWDLPKWSPTRHPRRSAFTTESPNFVCLPAQPRKIKKPRPSKVTAAPVITEQQPQYDEAGRPIVYRNTEDAWNYRVWR